MDGSDARSAPEARLMWRTPSARCCGLQPTVCILRHRWIIAITLRASSAWTQKPNRPSFDEYRVVDEYRGPVTQADFGRRQQYTGTDLRCFGGDPTPRLAMRTNFAGHFVLASCSCGSGCRYLFIWDARNGKVFRGFPFGAINVGPYPSAHGRQEVAYAGEQYRIDSKLLIHGRMH